MGRIEVEGLAGEEVTCPERAAATCSAALDRVRVTDEVTAPLPASGVGASNSRDALLPAVCRLDRRFRMAGGLPLRACL